MVRNILVGALAASLSATPVVAQTAQPSPATKLSVKNAVPSQARASGQSGKAGATGGSYTPYIIGGVLLLGGIIAIAASDDDNADSN